MKTSKCKFPVKVSQKFSIFGGNMDLTQLTFTCSKSTIETLEKGLKYIQS